MHVIIVLAFVTSFLGYVVLQWVCVFGITVQKVLCLFLSYDHLCLYIEEEIF